MKLRLRDVAPSAETSPLFDKVVHRTDLPRRTDWGPVPYYRTHKHTLYGRQEGVCGGCRTMFPFRRPSITSCRSPREATIIWTTCNCFAAPATA